jgi:DIM1 family U5 snRNP protein
MRQDEVLYRIADRVKAFAVIYLCDLDEVPDFKQMYELYDPMTLMFFFRNKHMMCDFGTGNNNKLNWVLEDKQELIDIFEAIYRGAKKGRGLVVSPKGAFQSRYLRNLAFLDRLLTGENQIIRQGTATEHLPTFSSSKLLSTRPVVDGSHRYRSRGNGYIEMIFWAVSSSPGLARTISRAITRVGNGVAKYLVSQHIITKSMTYIRSR